MPRTRLAGELGEIGTGTQASLRLCRLPVRPQIWPGPADTGLVAEPPGQNTETAILTGLSGLAAYVLDRFTNSHRKATEKKVHLSWLHMRPIQWHLKNNWKVPESRKGDPNS